MQFEWALKHVPPRNAGGIKNRIKKLYKLINKEYWTGNSPLAETMPLTIEWQYTDGTKEIDVLPAEIWRLNEYQITKTFIKSKQVEKVVLDPNFEYADTDVKNNSFPKVEAPSDFDNFKNKSEN